MSDSASRRVLFVQGTSNFGGSKRAMLNLIEALPAVGWHSVVACPERGWLTEQLEQLAVPFVCLRFLKWHKPVQRMFVPLAVRYQWRSALAPWPFDIVYANEFRWVPHATYLGNLSNVPVVVRFQGGNHDLSEADSYRLPKADAVITPSTALREKLKADPDLYGKTQVMYDGHDERRFQCAASREQVRREFGIAHDMFAIGNVGKLHERKNQRLLLRALAHLKREPRFPPLVVFFAGDATPDYERAMRDDIDKLGAHEAVRFLGRVNDIGRFFGAMDVIVHCSRREGLSLAVTEAMLAGKPVVMTAAEGARDVAPDDRYGLVVPVDDARALAAAIDRMISDETWRTRVAAQARGRARELFSLTTQAEQVARLLDELTSRREPPRNFGVTH